MAKKITFNIHNDVDADKFMNEVAIGLRYERQAIKNEANEIIETKPDFIKRMTIDYWKEAGAQGKVKLSVKTWKDEYNTMNID